MVNETADLFGLDLAGVEAWIRERAGTLPLRKV